MSELKEKSPEELKAMAVAIDKELADRNGAIKKRAVAQIRRIAKDAGLTVNISDRKKTGRPGKKKT
jgi:hypothetical protein